MKGKASLLFWLDVLLLLLSLALLATGAILRWVLPPGSGGERGEGFGLGRRGGRGPALTLWDMTRHEWGDVHFWIAVALVSGILLHVILHFGWIKGYIRHAIAGPR